MITTSFARMPIEMCQDHYGGYTAGAECNGVLLSEVKPDTNIETILCSLWSASPNERLEWLRAHAGLHPILMCELGLREYLVNPRDEIVQIIAIPLIHAARYRAMQDAQCSRDPQVLQRKPWNRLRNLYIDEIIKVWEEITHISPFSGSSRPWRKKVCEVMKQSMENSLPSPHWITGSSELYETPNWEVIRKQFANRTIVEMNDEIALTVSKNNPG
jgi:hypothetical protein